MDRIDLIAHLPDHVVAGLAASERQLESVDQATQAGHALARDRPNLVASPSIFNVGTLRTPGGQGTTAAVRPPRPEPRFGTPGRPDRLRRGSDSCRRAAG